MNDITARTLQLKTFITAFLSDPAHDNQSANSMTAEVFRIALASLESRTVTVKLSKRYSCEGYHIDEAYLQEDPEGDCYDRDEVLGALAATGIQVIEGEGQ